MADKTQKDKDLLERIDWQLLSILFLVALVIVSGLLSLFHPKISAQSDETIRVSTRYLSQFIYGFISLIVLLNVYMINKQMMLKKLKRELLNEQIQSELHKQLAVIDPLTETYNRRYFDEVVKHEIERCKRFGKLFSVILVDMDNFKRVNERFGHTTGDKVLREVGKLLKRSFRSVDSVVRYGGDEFLIMLPETDAAGVKAAANKLHLKMLEWADTNDLVDFPLTFSIGWATFDKNRTLEEVLKEADQKMFVNKGRRAVTTNPAPDVNV